MQCLMYKRVVRVTYDKYIQVLLQKVDFDHYEHMWLSKHYFDLTGETFHPCSEEPCHGSSLLQPTMYRMVALLALVTSGAFGGNADPKPSDRHLNDVFFYVMLSTGFSASPGDMHNATSTKNTPAVHFCSSSCSN
uniref:Ion_trans_2 domain-containing protein n=1 Tax=Steinernema glaseri TaxID=37863 RepID=A0A1I7Y041_9BILA